MRDVDFFIGVVSHEKSPFAANAAAGKSPADQLAQALDDLGASTRVQINVADLWDEGMDEGRLDPTWDVRLDPASVQRSLSAQIRAEDAWGRYLGGRSWWHHNGRMLKLRIGRFVRRFHRPDPTTIRRLLNIELSHLDLLQRGVDAQARWILILEDDAEIDDIPELARGLIGIAADGANTVNFVNLSASFPLSELGIERLLIPWAEGVWSGGTPRLILEARKPITNTVCAIAYTRAFAQQLLERWNDLPVDPVVPIDWKLNLALMHMTQNHARGRKAPERRSCLIIEPAPITQMSMRQQNQ